MYKQLLNTLDLHPKKIFLVDALGAFVTAIMLSVVLVRLESFFGLPPSALYWLAGIPILYIIYDLFVYFSVKKKIGKYLRGIATLNLIYCCISLATIIYHSETATIFGWIYVIGEISIIVAISLFELNMAKKLDT